MLPYRQQALINTVITRKLWWKLQPACSYSKEWQISFAPESLIYIFFSWGCGVVTFSEVKLIILNVALFEQVHTLHKLILYNVLQISLSRSVALSLSEANKHNPQKSSNSHFYHLMEQNDSNVSALWVCKDNSSIAVEALGSLLSLCGH